MANNSVECVIASALEGSENTSTNTTLRLVRIEPSDDWLYWMAGSTVAGFLSAIVTTVSVAVMIQAFRESEILKEEEKKEEKERRRTSGRPRTESTTPLAASGEGHTAAAAALQGEGEDQPDAESNTLDVIDDKIGSYEVAEWKHKPLRHFTAGSLAALFVSSLCLTGALLCLLWGIAIAFDYTRRVDLRVESFVLVDLLVGIGVPAFLFVSVALMAVVLDFITVGYLDARKAIAKILPAVKFLKGAKHYYWVIEGTFYFPLSRKRHHLEHGCCYACDKSRSTWYLSFILGLALTLAVSFFIDRAIIDIRTVTSCSDVDGSYDCFNATSYNHIDCVNNLFITRQIHCFRFLRIGSDVNILTALAESFAFYLFTLAFFAKIFGVVKILLHFKPSRLWGILFIVIGLLLFILAVVLLAVSDALVIQLDVIGALQFLMVSLFIVIIGILLVEGQWWEKVPTTAKVLDLRLEHVGEEGEIHELTRTTV